MASWFSRHEALDQVVPPSGWWVRLKTGLGLEAEEVEPTLLASIDAASTLSRTQRVYGFVFCLGLSVVFGLLATWFFLSPTRFAVLYTFSNLLMIASTMFLMGPLKQLKSMFDKGRIVASLVYLAAMALTLISAIYFQSFVLTVTFFIIQLGAMVWYALSYIPFAREMAMRLFGSLT